MRENAEYLEIVVKVFVVKQLEQEIDQNIEIVDCKIPTKFCKTRPVLFDIEY